MAMIQMGMPMARIEFVDADAVRAVNAYSGTDLPEMPHLFVEFHGSEAGAAEDAAAVRRGGGRFRRHRHPHSPRRPKTAPRSGPRATTPTGPASGCGPGRRRW